jgi:hypothetical protein
MLRRLRAPPYPLLHCDHEKPPLREVQSPLNGQQLAGNRGFLQPTNQRARSIKQSLTDQDSFIHSVLPLQSQPGALCARLYCAARFSPCAARALLSLSPPVTAQSQPFR